MLTHIQVSSKNWPNLSMRVSQINETVSWIQVLFVSPYFLMLFRPNCELFSALYAHTNKSIFFYFATLVRFSQKQSHFLLWVRFFSWSTIAGRIPISLLSLILRYWLHLNQYEASYLMENDWHLQIYSAIITTHNQLKSQGHTTDKIFLHYCV